MKFWAFLIVMLLAFASCGRNGPQKLAIDKANTYRQFKEKPACSEIDFSQNYLEQKNLLAFFRCLGWAENYPTLFHKVESYDKSKWDALFLKLNNGIFGRDNVGKFLDYLLRQKSQGKIISLQKAITDLSEVDNLEKLFSDFVSFLNSHPEYKKKSVFDADEFKNMIEFLVNVLTGLNAVKAELKKQASFNQDSFEDDLIILIDQITLSYTGSSFTSLEKLSKFFLGVEDNWIRKRFLNQPPSKTKYVLDFAFNNLDRTKRLLEGISTLIAKKEISCYHAKTIFSLDHNAEISSRLLDSTRMEHSEFMLSLLDLGQKFTFLKEICRSDTNFEEEMNIVENNLNYLFDFVRDESSFYFFKNLQFATTNGDEKNITGFTSFLLSPDMEILTRFLYKYLVHNEKYFAAMFAGLKSMPNETFKNFGLVIKKIKDKESFGINLLANFWQGLSRDSKKAFLRIIETPILSEDTSATALLDLLNFLLNNYPDVIDNLVTDIGIIFEDSSDLDIFFEFFVNKEIFNELRLLIKNNGILKLVEILAGEKKEIKFKKIEINFKNENELSQEEDASTTCLKEILALNIKGYRYGDIVGMMPQSCNEGKESFISKIFQVSNLLRKKIENEGDRLDAFDKGIFSSNFLKIHAAFFLSETVKIKFDQRQNIKKQVLDVADALGVILNILKRNNLLKPILNSSVKSFVGQDLDLSFAKRDADIDCIEKREIGEISCKDKNAFIKNMDTFISKLLEDNGGEILLHNLLDAFHLEHGVSIPYNKKRQREHILSIENIIEFLYDHSEKKRDVEVYYFAKNRNKPQAYYLNLLERLEIVIREIAFSHNYYGAYFVNEIAQAKNYRWKTKRFRFNLKAMSKAMPLFIKKNYVEEDDQRRLVNITNNYSSLYELDYLTPKYTSGNYADLIQSVLTLLVESSGEESRHLAMMSRPSAEVTQKHSVGFITALVNMSGFSKMAMFLRKYVSNNKKEFFENEKINTIIKWINKELVRSENKKYLKRFLGRLTVEDYELLWDMVEQFEAKSLDFKKSFVKMIGDFFYLMANNELSFKTLMETLEYNVKNLDDMKTIIDMPEIVLGITSDVLSHLASGHKNELRVIWKKEYFNSLLVQVRKITSLSFEVSNKKYLQNILLNYQNEIKQNNLKNDDYFYKLFSLLLKEDKNNFSLLNHMLEILFNEKGEQLPEFLEDLSRKLTISL